MRSLRGRSVRQVVTVASTEPTAQPSSSPSAALAAARDDQPWPWPDNGRDAQGRVRVIGWAGGITYPHPDTLRDPVKIAAWIDLIDDELTALRRLQSRNDALITATLAGAPVGLLALAITYWFTLALAHQPASLNEIGAALFTLGALMYLLVVGLWFIATAPRVMWARGWPPPWRAAETAVVELAALRRCYLQRQRLLTAATPEAPLWPTTDTPTPTASARHRTQGEATR